MAEERVPKNAPGAQRAAGDAPSAARGEAAAGRSGKKRSRRRRGHRRTKPGDSPGTLIADPDSRAPVMTVIAYSPSELVEKRITHPREVRELLAKFPVVWLDVDGLGDVETVRAVGEVFGLHRLELEDIVNVHQRPKIERYEGHRFLVARMIDVQGGVLDTEQLSLFLGARFVLTFQEREGDGFGPVRERIRGSKGVIRSSGPDYLAYALLDATIDEYFPVLEGCGERLENLEDGICNQPRPSLLRELHAVKRELLQLRRAIWPLREALGQLQRDGDELIQASTRPYLNDCYDHTVQLMDLVETYREIASGQLDIYLSSVSYRLNEVMMLLTVLATIFIPLTFLSSIWGMNFDFMPELKWRYGYFAALGVMLVVALALLAFFWRRGWIGERSRDDDAHVASAATRAAPDDIPPPPVPGTSNPALDAKRIERAASGAAAPRATTPPPEPPRA